MINQKKIKKLSILVIIFLLLNFILFNNIESLKNTKRRFSNTQKLGGKEKMNYIKKDEEITELYNMIPHIDYPKNDSKITKSEIEQLLEYKKNRKRNLKETIYNELILSNVIKKFTTNYDEVITLYYHILNVIEPVIIKVKVKYDRVRPSYLNDNIKPVIDKPNHPSYPSGHAVQSYFIAYILSHRYPNNKKKYLNIANTISLNREKGGFHYKSDTEYGKLIGKILADYYKGENDLFSLI